MKDEILTYWEMCARENMSLQKGMNFRKPPRASIVLMSQRKNAPYEDALSDDGTILFYEGHDVRKTADLNPKTVDQPWTDLGQRPTENARFATAVEKPEDEDPDPPLVKVYEKLLPGIWSDKGLLVLKGYDYSSKKSEN
jgi:hypothetical protein